MQPQSFNPVTSSERDPFIKEFTVYANPNAGKFTVHVLLSDESNIRLRMFNINSNALVSDMQKSNGKDYRIPYDLVVAPGIYMMLLETPNGNRIYKVIIN
ncbi:MAG: T9SS type A sorting domain-containing protein [Sphingobacteriales bacterium]|nr:T9SS type A sorting domain-containing protein [Sphingobacteriales bacterium]